MYRLDFFTLKPKENEPPMNPVIHIYAKVTMQHNYPGYENMILLSPQLMTEQEIDLEVDKLISNLEEIRNKAKKSLKEK